MFDIKLIQDTTEKNKYHLISLGQVFGYGLQTHILTVKKFIDVYYVITTFSRLVFNLQNN